MSWRSHCLEMEKETEKTNCHNNVMGACNFPDSFFPNLFYQLRLRPRFWSLDPYSSWPPQSRHLVSYSNLKNASSFITSAIREKLPSGNIQI
nr:hypothetical protein CFP56_05942 [Quercus suber]